MSELSGQKLFDFFGTWDIYTVLGLKHGFSAANAEGKEEAAEGGADGAEGKEGKEGKGGGSAASPPTEKEITKAFRKLSLKYHPDKFVGKDYTEEARAMFEKVTLAKEVLTDAKRVRRS
jgi:hypothetical protein